MDIGPRCYCNRAAMSGVQDDGETAAPPSGGLTEFTRYDASRDKRRTDDDDDEEMLS